MHEPDQQNPFRQRIRQYGPFTPAALATAWEMGRRMPYPADEKLIGYLKADRPGQRVVSVTLPNGVIHRLMAFAGARGISFNRLCAELLTYYVSAVTDDQIKLIPAFYADLLAPEGIRVLAQALALAQQEMGVTPPTRPTMKPSDAEFGSDISLEEKERLSNW